MEEWEGQGSIFLMAQKEHYALLGVTMGKGMLWALSDPMSHSAVSMAGRGVLWDRGFGCPVHPKE